MVLSTKTKKTPASKPAGKSNPHPPTEKPDFLQAKFVLALGMLALLVTGSAVMGFWLGISRPGHIANYRGLSSEQLAALPDDAKPLHPGPWGNMEYTPIYIEPPEEYLPVQAIQEADRRWRFAGFSIAQLTELFQKADLSDEQRTELLDASKWQQTADAIYVNPSKDLVLSLSPRARKQIYAPLTTDPTNIFSFIRCSYPADQFETYLAHGGLSDATIALVKRLSFPYGHLVFFLRYAPGPGHPAIVRRESPAAQDPAPEINLAPSPAHHAEFRHQ